MLIGLLVVMVAILVGLWVGRRSGAQFISKVAFEDAEKVFMTRGRAKQMERGFKSQAEVLQMTPKEMESHISLSTDTRLNEADPYGDGDQSEHDAESTEGRILRQVWSSGADYSDEVGSGISIIHRLCLMGNVKKVTQLLDRADDEGERRRLLEKRISVLRVTPLMATVTARRFLPKEALRAIPANNHVQIVKLLLEAGARTDAKDVAGHSALHKAAGEFATPTSWAMAKEILKAGANINSRSRFGETTLFRNTCVSPKSDGAGQEVDGELIPNMALWLVASGASLDIGTTGTAVHIMTPRECPPLTLMRQLLATELERKYALATGPYKAHLARQLKKGIELGPEKSKFHRRDGPSSQTIIEEGNAWQEQFNKQLPQIKAFIRESLEWTNHTAQ